MDFSVLEKTKDHPGLLKILLPFIDEEQRRYAPFHKESEYNALFYLGKHWIVPREGSDGFDVIQDTSSEDHFYPVTNFTKRLTDIKVNQIVGKRFIPVIKPNSLQPDDIERARLGHLALRAKNELDKEADNYRMVALHSALFGVGWAVDYKRPTGQYIVEPRMEQTDQGTDSCEPCGLEGQNMPGCPACGQETAHNEKMVEQPVVDETGMPVIDRTPVYEPCSEVVDIFRIMVSAGPSNRRPRWLVETSLQRVSWIKEKFKISDTMEPPPGFTGAIEKVCKCDVLPRRMKISEDLKVTFEHKHSAVYNSTSTSVIKHEGDETLLHKLYAEPCESYPSGRLIIFTPTAVLYDGAPDVPEKSRKYGIWLPHTPMIFTPHPARYEGIPFVSDLIAKNKQLNGIDALILEHLDKTADPERIEYDNVIKNDDDNAGTIRLKPVPGLPNGGAPSYMTVTQIASELYSYRQTVIDEMKELANVNDVVQGMHPAGVDTYRGMQLLRDESESLEADLYSRYSRFLKAKSQLRLCLMQECLLSEDKQLLEMMKILADQEGMSTSAIANFAGHDIGDQWSVVIEQTDELSDSKSAEAEAVQSAVKAGIISQAEMEDPLIKFDTLQKLGLGSSVETFGSDDIKKMLWMIQLLEGQKFPEVVKAIMPFDNKPLQLRVLIRWMKMPKFYDYAPPVQQAALALQRRLEQDMMSGKLPAPQEGGQPTNPQGGENAE